MRNKNKRSVIYMLYKSINIYQKSLYIFKNLIKSKEKNPDKLLKR